MDRQPVQSSNIRSIGYDLDASVLEIEFQNGSIYQYSAVPEDVHARFMHAASKGKFLNTQIKDRYRSHQVR